RNGHLGAVDRERDEPVAVAHPSTSPSASSCAGGAATAAAAVSSPGSTNGQRPNRTCSSYSSRKYLTEESIGDTVPSASAPNAVSALRSGAPPAIASRSRAVVSIGAS